MRNDVREFRTDEGKVEQRLVDLADRNALIPAGSIFTCSGPDPHDVAVAVNSIFRYARVKQDDFRPAAGQPPIVNKERIQPCAHCGAEWALNNKLHVKGRGWVPEESDNG